MLLLLYLQFCFSESNRLDFYFKYHKHLKTLIWLLLNVQYFKVTCNININRFDLHLKLFTPLTVYILLCFTNKLFVDMVYKHLFSGMYFNKSYKSLSALVHFFLFTIYLTYLSSECYFLHEMIRYGLRVACCELYVAILRKLIYELRVAFYELQF